MAVLPLHFQVQLQVRCHRRAAPAAARARSGMVTVRGVADKTMDTAKHHQPLHDTNEDSTGIASWTSRRA